MRILLHVTDQFRVVSESGQEKVIVVGPGGGRLREARLEAIREAIRLGPGAKVFLRDWQGYVTKVFG